MTPEQVRVLSLVEQQIQMNRPDDALRLLDQVAGELETEPRVWWSRATIAQMNGDPATAEQALLRTAELDPRAPFASMALGDLFYGQERLDEALAAWRDAHSRDPGFKPATLHLAEYLLSTGDAAGAIEVLSTSLRRGDDPALLTMRAQALSTAGRNAEAIADYRSAVAASRRAPQTLRNLATALVADGQIAEGEAKARQALDAAPRDPNLWQVLGRALEARNALAEAQAAYEKAIEIDPVHPGGHRDLAHLTWARTGDIEPVVARLDRAMAGAVGVSPLIVVKAKLLETSGDVAGARKLLSEAAALPDAPNYLLCAASQILVDSDRLQAATLAATAVSRAPGDTFGLAVLAEAQLSAGDIDGALITAGRIRALAPFNQHGLALLATAQRLKGDPGYKALYDYDAMVSTTVLETPEGWSDLAAWLADLKAALGELHGHVAHPVGQSLRGGTQTTVRLDHSDNPAIQAFFKAIDAPIRAYIAALGQGDDPLRSRANGEAWRLSGSWSVRLAPGGGRHVDHLHDAGWISSAFYVDLPPSVLADGDQGSLRFGQPGTPTRPALEAEHRIKPQAGLLALFPSYMWHGTEPFDGDQPRLTIAFDVIPG